MSVIQELTLSSYEGLVDPDWCLGCGDFAVLKSLKAAVLELGIQPHDILVVSGIGCSSNLPGFIHSYGVHSLHGRSLPVASGIALANHNLHVLAVGGDGDGYGIGSAHFLHTMRRNLNLTYIVMNNQIYGLTTGQASPTTTVLKACRRTVVVECNYSGQFARHLRAESGYSTDHLVTRYDGEPFEPAGITRRVRDIVEGRPYDGRVAETEAQEIAYHFIRIHLKDKARPRRLVEVAKNGYGEPVWDIEIINRP